MKLYKYYNKRITRFFYNQSFFSTQTQWSLTFSWICLQILFRCCLIHIAITILRHYTFCIFSIFVSMSKPRSMLYLYDLFFIFNLFFIVIDHLTSFKQTHCSLVFCTFFRISHLIFWMKTWMKKARNFQKAKVYPQGVAYLLFEF